MGFGLPLLAVFGGLFVGADAVFKSLLVGAVPNLHAVWSHLLIVCGAGWLSAGLLRDLLATREDERLVAPTLAARLPALPGPQRTQLARSLLLRSERGGGVRVLGWSASRAKASAVLSEHRTELVRLARLP